MFLIRTIVAPSRIHGVGTFAAEDAAEGQVIWRFDPAYDLVIPVSRLESLPEAFRHYLETYAYLAQEIPDSYVLSCDHAKFLNHSEEPNTALRPFETLARVPIRAGDEITCDYRAFVAGWDGFEPKTA